MVCPKQSRFVVCLLISKVVRWAVMPNRVFFLITVFQEIRIFPVKTKASTKKAGDKGWGGKLNCKGF